MNKKTSILSIFTAVGASLCCIVPLLSVAVGFSGAMSMFQWAEPLRIPFAVLTIALLTFAWYREVKQPCPCEPSQRRRRRFVLFGSTIFALAILSFPYFTSLPAQQPTTIATPTNTKFKTIRLQITGMTCQSCVGHIKQVLNKEIGIIEYEVTYSPPETKISFDPQKTNTPKIQKAIKSTGYSTSLKENT